MVNGVAPDGLPAADETLRPWPNADAIERSARTDRRLTPSALVQTVFDRKRRGLEDIPPS
jgi:hypothetical protein